MQPVAVGIGQDADLAVAQPAEIGRARIDAERDGNVVDLLRGEDLAAIQLPGVQDLALQRHDRLEHAVARLLGRTARGVTLDEEQLGAVEILRGAVGELARQRRSRGDLLALDLAAGGAMMDGARATGTVPSLCLEAAASREDRRSLVWPLNCGSRSLADST